MELIVPVAGGEIWAEDSGGDGTPLVLVHPDWGNADIWAPLAGLLRDRFRVIRYDDRGFGRSPAPAVSFSRAGDLRAVLDYAGVKNAVIAGHSGGGGTALSLAAAARPRPAGADHHRARRPALSLGTRLAGAGPEPSQQRALDPRP